MNPPKVTIITVCRNGADTIEDTIRSVIGQGYGNLEYIIVDAESDDGTADIIERYKDHVTVWIREPDNGITDAWNKGIKRATGEIIGIINADDFYASGTIATVIDVFANNAGCGFVFGDLTMVNGATGRSYKVPGRPEYIESTRYHMLGVPHPTVFVGKWVYDEVGLFDTRYRICADYELIRRVITKGIKGICIPRTLTIMREGGVAERERTLLLREVKTISITYGANRAIAWLLFSMKYLRFQIGKTIARCGLSLSTQRWLVHGKNDLFRRSDR
jgi:glycosyltransferase involved in cell wall biosynthesis